MFHFSPLGECVLTGKDIGQEISEMRRFAGLLLGAGSAVLLFGLAGGWWLSSRTIRPIQSISATAAKIARGDLSQRIPVADTENELDQLARVLNSTFARLEAAFAQQTRFTSDAAHELRTPVSVILAQTQSTLNRERSTAEYRETLEACQRAAQRMRRLTESLLELARLDTGNDLIQKARVNLAQITTECIEFVRPLAANRQISIQSDLSPAACAGEVDRLKQVIINLLTNAIQYNKEAGNIQVCVEQNGEFANLTVADTGIGISAEDLPHIFERFWRADQARSHAERHTGLGLAIAKSIVDAHGGTMEISSELEKGSTFTVRLPI
jgi:heavy metal sensor kinase